MRDPEIVGERRQLVTRWTIPDQQKMRVRRRIGAGEKSHDQVRPVPLTDETDKADDEAPVERQLSLCRGTVGGCATLMMWPAPAVCSGSLFDVMNPYALGQSA